MKTQEYYEKVTATCCDSTINGWLWYCDVHDTHGNADSEDEAQFIAESHEMHKVMVDGDKDGCDLYVASVNRARVEATERARKQSYVEKTATTWLTPNHGKEWTGPELELLLRSDLTTRQMAQLLGRTYFSVASQRQAIGTPRSSVLAGKSSETRQ